MPVVLNQMVGPSFFFWLFKYCLRLLNYFLVPFLGIVVLSTRDAPIVCGCAVQGPRGGVVNYYTSGCVTVQGKPEVRALLLEAVMAWTKAGRQSSSSSSAQPRPDPAAYRFRPY